MLPLTVVASASPGVYSNPLPARTANNNVVENCPDPSVLRGRGRYADRWYMYCTTGPYNDSETVRAGTPAMHRLPILVSRNLVHWKIAGTGLPKPPTWAASGAQWWAPDVVYSATYKRYYLTYVVTDTVRAVSGAPSCDKDSAIAVATSSTPVGPWRVAKTPLVPPVRTGTGCSFATTIDPDVLGNTVRDRGVLFFGGFRGGIQGQRVRFSRYGMALTGTRQRITTHRYEAPNVVRRGTFYYLFASAGHCCKGALSEYGVLAGRSTRPLGPYKDREGNSLMAARTGGTPVLHTNSNRWVGPGHTSVLRDFGGQWWSFHHAIDRFDPYFAGRLGFTRRPVLLDPLDWVNGWPSVRSGGGVSADPTPLPAARPGRRSAYRPRPVAHDLPGTPLLASWDELNGDRLDTRWSWVREPDAAGYFLTGSQLDLQTAEGDLSDEGRAPVLVQSAPSGDYVVETALRLDVPSQGLVSGHPRAGLVVYVQDDRFVSLLHGAPGSIRMTEFGKKVPAGDPRLPEYGATSVGPPGDLTRLRLVRRVVGGVDVFTAYTRQDDRRWIRGGTWTYEGLGNAARIGLVALGGKGFTASFDYVRTWTVD